MERKVVDILPPTKERKKIEELLPEKKPIFRFKRPVVRISPPPFKKSLFIIPFILIIVGIIIGLNLSRAEIEIWPEAEVLTFKTKLNVDQKAENVDFLNKVIPGKVFEAEKTVLEEFPSSGKREKAEKARGTIRVYNAYSTSPQVLLATTRFVSAEGKLFRTPIQVTIAGGYYEKGKLVPGFTDIEVIADQPGPEYNIGPTTFSIPGFAGTPRYTAFYGKSFDPMTGGIREETPIITQEDLDRAKKILEEKALEESKTALKNKIPAEFDFLEEASKAEITETFSLARPGAELEKFSYQVKAKSRALVFKSSDIENFANEFILSQVPQQKRIYRESLKVNYSLQATDFELGKITLSLTIEAKIYSPLDEISLKKALGGKSLAETQIFLENQPQITKTVVKFWPFWVKKVPENLEKIKIEFNLD